MRYLLPAVLCLALALPSEVRAETILVPQEQPTIQAGIDAAGDGDTVLVSPGTYTGEGNRDLDFLGMGIVLISVSGAEETVIDCEESGRGVNFRSGEGPETRLEGFTIRSGLLLQSPYLGYGIYCVDSSPVIAECKVEECGIEFVTCGDGGGAYCLRSSPVFIGCIISRNYVFRGGGIYLEDCAAPIISDCDITGNSTTGGGGGFCIDNSCLTMKSSSISENRTESDGGGIWLTSGSSQSVLSNSTIRNNRAWDSGGGISGTAFIIESHISGNSVSPYGNGGGVYGGATLLGCIIDGNRAGDWGCDNSANGGGVYCIDGLLDGCIIRYNEVITRMNLGGGGVYAIGNSLIDNCEIIGNKVYSGDGGGLFLKDEACVINSIIDSNILTIETYGEEVRYGAGAHGGTILHSVIVNNSGRYDEGEFGGGIYHPAKVTNCIVWNNTGYQILPENSPNVTFCDVQGGYPGLSNIHLDPMFTGNYRIQEESPCIDSGTDTGVYIDIDGDERPVGFGFDIGIDEKCWAGPKLGYYPSLFRIRTHHPETMQPDTSLCLAALGTEPVSYAIIPNAQDWLTLDGDLTGELAPGDSGAVNLRFDLSGLELGCYADTLHIEWSSGVDHLESIPVNLSINSSAMIRRVPWDYPDIFNAVQTACKGDTVLIADGTYEGPGNRDIDLLGKAVAVMSENGPEATVLDCWPGRGFYIHSGERLNTRIIGLTITNGNAPGGGGLRIEESSPTISNCFITENRARETGYYQYGVGGGVYLYDSSSLIEECIISNNIGGGIYYGYGGGLYLRGCSMYIERSQITDNRAGSDGGGGIYSKDSIVLVENCTLSRNKSNRGFGGAIRHTGISPMIIVNSIIWANTIEQITGDNFDIEYSDTSPLWAGTGNISENPRFSNPLQGDFTLSAGSPCIDAGDPAFRVPRGGGEVIDMGAFEFQHGWNIYVRPEL